jgi:GcrA cell cycle regulator
VPAKPAPEIADKTSLLDLNDRICKWPVGHPGEPDFHFCGQQANPGYPYCVQHCGVAYQAQLPAATAARPRRCLRRAAGALIFSWPA